ncbi:MAG: HEAT repeat domain-containing protein [Candidatus Margulisiibacteriota bacterium]
MAGLNAVSSVSLGWVVRSAMAQSGGAEYEKIFGLGYFDVSESDAVQAAAINELAAFGTAGAAAILARVAAEKGTLVNDLSPAIRKQAVIALRGFGDKAQGAVPTLISLYEDNEESFEMRLAVLQTLGRVNGTNAAGAMTIARAFMETAPLGVSKGQPDLYAAAEQAMRNLDAEAFDEAAIEFLVSNSSSSAVQDTLVRIGPRANVPLRLREVKFGIYEGNIAIITIKGAIKNKDVSTLRAVVLDKDYGVKNRLVALNALGSVDADYLAFLLDVICAGPVVVNPDSADRYELTSSDRIVKRALELWEKGRAAREVVGSESEEIKVGEKVVVDRLMSCSVPPEIAKPLLLEISAWPDVSEDIQVEIIDRSLDLGMRLAIMKKCIENAVRQADPTADLIGLYSKLLESDIVWAPGETAEVADAIFSALGEVGDASAMPFIYGKYRNCKDENLREGLRKVGVQVVKRLSEAELGGTLKYLLDILPERQRRTINFNFCVAGANELALLPSRLSYVERIALLPLRLRPYAFTIACGSRPDINRSEDTQLVFLQSEIGLDILLQGACSSDPDTKSKARSLLRVYGDDFYQEISDYAGDWARSGETQVFAKTLLAEIERKPVRVIGVRRANLRRGEEPQSPQTTAYALLLDIHHVPKSSYAKLIIQSPEGQNYVQSCDPGGEKNCQVEFGENLFCIYLNKKNPQVNAWLNFYDGSDNFVGASNHFVVTNPGARQ